MYDEMRLIELKGISKSFRRIPRYCAMWIFTFAKSEFLTLLGPSGCGKTTMLRIIGGFEIAGSRARCIFEGKDITDVPPYQAAGQHRVPEIRPVYPHERRSTTSPSA